MNDNSNVNNSTPVPLTPKPAHSMSATTVNIIRIAFLLALTILSFFIGTEYGNDFLVKVGIKNEDVETTQTDNSTPVSYSQQQETDIGSADTTICGLKTYTNSNYPTFVLPYDSCQWNLAETFSTNTHSDNPGMPATTEYKITLNYTKNSQSDELPQLELFLKPNVLENELGGCVQIITWDAPMTNAVKLYTGASVYNYINGYVLQGQPGFSELASRSTIENPNICYSGTYSLSSNLKTTYSADPYLAYNSNLKAGDKLNATLTSILVGSNNNSYDIEADKIINNMKL